MVMFNLQGRNPDLSGDERHPYFFMVILHISSLCHYAIMATSNVYTGPESRPCHIMMKQPHPIVHCTYLLLINVKDRNPDPHH